jgi:hypothetical protein
MYEEGRTSSIGEERWKEGEKININLEHKDEERTLEKESATSKQQLCFNRV